METPAAKKKKKKGIAASSIRSGAFESHDWKTECTLVGGSIQWHFLFSLDLKGRAEVVRRRRLLIHRNLLFCFGLFVSCGSIAAATVATKSLSFLLETERNANNRPVDSGEGKQVAQ